MSHFSDMTFVSVICGYGLDCHQLQTHHQICQQVSRTKMNYCKKTNHSGDLHKQFPLTRQSIYTEWWRLHYLLDEFYDNQCMFHVFSGVFCVRYLSIDANLYLVAFEEGECTTRFEAVMVWDTLNMTIFLDLLPGYFWSLPLSLRCLIQSFW